MSFHLLSDVRQPPLMKKGLKHLERGRPMPDELKEGQTTSPDEKGIETSRFGRSRFGRSRFGVRQPPLMKKGLKHWISSRFDDIVEDIVRQPPLMKKGLKPRPGGAFIEMAVPKGSRATTGYSHENELVFARGSGIQVISSEQVDGRFLVKAKLVQPLLEKENEG